VHTSGTVNGTDAPGQPTSTHAQPGVSPADKKYQKGLEKAGYKGTAIQVDTYGTDKVNVYTGVQYNGTDYSISDWNKRFTSQSTQDQ
jgi:hypothetical protein